MGYARLERGREKLSAWGEAEEQNPEGSIAKHVCTCTEDVIEVEATMTKASQSRGSLLLRVALVLLSLAVFYWGIALQVVLV